MKGYKQRAGPGTMIKIAILVVGIVAVWNFASTKSTPLFVPSPESVVSGLFSLAQSGQLWKSFEYSFARITVASAISAAIAVPIGMLIYASPNAHDIISPMANVMRFIPVTAFYPLLTMWFGIGEKMKISFLFLATFVYMLPSVVLALEDVSNDIIEAASVMGANKFQMMTRICLPVALPEISQTFLMMYGIGWTYIAVCEQTNAKYGLGFLIYTSSARGRTYLVFAAIVVIIFMSAILDTFGSKLIKRIFDWKFSE